MVTINPSHPLVKHLSNRLVAAVISTKPGWVHIDLSSEDQRLNGCVVRFGVSCYPVPLYGVLVAEAEDGRCRTGLSMRLDIWDTSDVAVVLPEAVLEVPDLPDVPWWQLDAGMCVRDTPLQRRRMAEVRDRLRVLQERMPLPEQLLVDRPKRVVAEHFAVPDIDGKLANLQAQV